MLCAAFLPISININPRKSKCFHNMDEWFEPFLELSCRFSSLMASWWRSSDTAEGVDLEENLLVSRVIQAVGLFGDILSIEDTMEPFLSEMKREHRDGETAAGGKKEEEMPMKKEEVHRLEEAKERQGGEESEGMQGDEKKEQPGKDDEKEEEKQVKEAEEETGGEKNEEQEDTQHPELLKQVMKTENQEKEEVCDTEQKEEKKDRTQEEKEEERGETGGDQEREEGEDEAKMEEDKGQGQERNVRKEEKGGQDGGGEEERDEEEKQDLEKFEEEEKDEEQTRQKETVEEEKKDKQEQKQEDVKGEREEEKEEQEAMTAGEEDVEENVKSEIEQEDEVKVEDEEQTEGGKQTVEVKEGEEKEKENERGEEVEALVGRQENAEEEETETQRPPPPACPLDPAETPGGDGAETGFGAQREETKDSDAAKIHNGDIYPTSAGRDKEEEGPETKTDSLTDINVPSVHVALNLRYLTNQEIQRLEERSLALLVTSLPVPEEQIELAEEAVDEDTWEIIPDLHTDPQDLGNSLLVSMEAGGPESNEPSPIQNSSSTENSAMDPKEDNEARVEGGKNSQQTNSGADAANDKKNGNTQPSKYKTVSYRRIRRGNTRQRIDEFEAMMDS